MENKKINLIKELKSVFDENNQIAECNVKINNTSFSIFYIECLIDKKLFSSAIMEPIEKLAKSSSQQMGSGINSEEQSTGQQESSGQQSGAQQEEEQSVGQQDKNEQINLRQSPSQNDNELEDGTKNYEKKHSGQNQSDKQRSAMQKVEQSCAEQESSSQQGEDQVNNGQSSGQQDGDQSSSGQSSSFQDIFSKIYLSISVSSKEECTELKKIKENLFAGQVVILFEEKAICCPIFSPEQRSIEEPPNGKVIKGPREGFVEGLAINTGLIRKRLRTETLKIIDIYVGERSKTKISVFYMEDIARPEIVEEIVSQIKKISIDAVLDSYYVESFLEKGKLRFVKRFGNTEKPDVFCAKILEGRVGLLVDGSPIALTAPFILLEDLQSPGDYYSLPAIATFARVMRFIGLFVSVFAPAIYVALESYNYRILSVNFLITILSCIEGLAIPPLLETLVVLFLFEIITEASLRMPDPLGTALSIIGALALGNTAVDAGIISPPSIVVVAVSSVALYIIPDQISVTRILRLIVTAIGGILGLYGIFVSVVIITTYLSSIESYGVPYLAPYAPRVKNDLNDAITMKPIEDLKTRPKIFAGKDKIRQRREKK